MKLISRKNNIFHIEFPNRKELTFTMGRVGEYYESGHKNLRNKIFTLEDFLDTFMNDKGEVNYFDGWSGYNIPSHKFYEFYSRFKDLTSRESKMYNLIDKHSEGIDKFYIIATMAGDNLTITHEVAHALYYLNPQYKRRADKLVKALDADLHKKLVDRMLEWGYGRAVLVDEVNAYMATSPASYMRKRFGLSGITKEMKPFTTLLNEYMELI
jgi:hypothetical protein